MTPGFVGTCTMSSKAELETLLKSHAHGQGCYFLRWTHGVSGFIQELPANFERAEGQMFTGDRELRWKPQGQEFDVLLLSKGDIQNSDSLMTDFSPIEGKWIVQDWDAHVYPSTETRLPKGIVQNGVNIGQRYFINQTTGTIHFVSLVSKGG